MSEYRINRRRLLSAVTALPFLSARSAFASAPSDVTLLDPAGPLDDWKDRNRSSSVSWNVSGEGIDSAVEVHSNSAFAVLSREVDIEIANASRLTWSWRVDELPDTADLTSVDTDDLGAGVALVFGKPGLLRKVPPMLIYTWASSANDVNEIITCQRHPEAMRFVIVRSGLDKGSIWHSESRDIVRDYKAAFGSAPSDRIHAVALWSDSDQTGESTRAAFGPITLHSGLSRV